MNNIQIYCKATPPSGTETSYKLDLLQGDPIKITLQVEETGSVSSSYTQTFRIPVTENNERVFKGSCDVNNITFNPRLKISTTISVGGNIFQEGYILLQKVIRNFKNGSCFYEVAFFGEVGDFKAALGTKTLNDLDTTSLNHIRNLTVIETSWGAPTYQALQDGSSPNIGLFGGDVIYPLVEYGYDYDPASNTPDPLLNNTISDASCNGSFLKSSNPLHQFQFKPVLRAKWILDKIFSEAGYSYDSVFFNSNIFYPIYVLGDSSPRGRTLATQISTALLRTDPTRLPSGEYWNGWNGRPAPYGLPSQNLIMVGPNAGRYECGSSGLYDFFATFWPTEVYGSFTTLGLKTISIDMMMDVFDFTDNISLGTFPVFTVVRNMNIGTNQVILLGDHIVMGNMTLAGISLVQGHRVGVRTDVSVVITAGTGAITNVTYWPLVGLNQRVYPNATTSQIQPELSRKMKQIDFLLGLIRKFKLVVEADPTDRKRLLIEPWVDWLNKGEKRDWSGKLDSSSDFVFEPIFNNRKRNFILTDRIDSDWANENFKKANLKVFGEYKYDSGIENLEGDEVVECPFTPTILGTMGLCSNTNPPLPGNAVVAVTSITKDNSPYTNTGTRDPIEANPRLCFWNGPLSLPEVDETPPFWYIMNDLGEPHPEEKWPMVSYHTHWPFFGETHSNFTLAYELETFGNYLQPYYLFDADTASKRYWEPWLDLYYDRPFSGFNNRRATCKLYLQDKDLIGFKFNTKVFLAGTWWLVSKINNYNLGVGGLTDVELIQFGYTNTSI